MIKGNEGKDLVTAEGQFGTSYYMSHIAYLFLSFPVLSFAWFLLGHFFEVTIEGRSSQITREDCLNFTLDEPNR
ncbi:unnamed protein product [Arctia plantaginis]|uniref:Uncharacterized protein n=1 Tax=Arctia plantaginis TaxID=874455 RepID=A0A8S0ZYK2_ARCPL|nr:unnamed protein product [Arctia plantaginis]